MSMFSGFVIVPLSQDDIYSFQIHHPKQTLVESKCQTGKVPHSKAFPFHTVHGAGDCEVSADTHPVRVKTLSNFTEKNVTKRIFRISLISSFS